MVAEKGHPNPHLKAARQIQKKCAAASILYMLYPTITWVWNLVLYSIESACQSGVLSDIVCPCIDKI